MTSSLPLGVAVVGSGPAALAAVQAWRSFDLETPIEIIDIGRKLDSASSKELTGVALKSYQGSTFSYDQNEFLKLSHVGMKETVWPSAGFGGFSRVWGAALSDDLASSSNIFEPSAVFDSKNPISPLFTRSGKLVSNRVTKRQDKLKKIGVQFSRHSLAVDESKCIKCGDCLTGCPTNAIWNAGSQWSDIPNLTFRFGRPVVGIQEADDSVFVSIAGEGSPRQYSKVLLAAGAIGTSAILMRSGLLPDKVSIQDSATVFIPLLRLPTREEKGSFALSQLSFSISDSSMSKMHIQLYPDSRKMVDRAIRILPKAKTLITILWKMIAPFTCAAIGFLDSADSDSLGLEMSNDGSFKLSPIQSPTSIQQRRSAKKLLSRSFRGMGLVMIPAVVRFAEPGEGYHSGGVQGLTNLGPLALVPNCRSIHLIDGSTLSKIPAGPITVAIAERARSVVLAMREQNG